MWVDAVPWLSYSRLVSLGREVLAGQSPPFGSADGPGKAYGDELTYAIVRRTLEISAQRGWPVVLLTVGVEHPDRQQRLQALADQANVAVLESPGRSDDREMYYRLDAHWNATGHRRIADMLFQKIVESEARLHLTPQRASR